MSTQKQLFDGVSHMPTTLDHLCASGTFVRVIEIHSVEANDSNFIWNNLDSKIRSPLENLQIGERNELAPYTEGQNIRDVLSSSSLIDRKNTYDENSFVMELGPRARLNSVIVMTM